MSQFSIHLFEIISNIVTRSSHDGVVPYFASAFELAKKPKFTAYLPARKFKGYLLVFL